MKTYPIADTVTETTEFSANGERYFLVQKSKFDCNQHESVALDKRDILKLYMAIQDNVLNGEVPNGHKG